MVLAFGWCQNGWRCHPAACSHVSVSHVSCKRRQLNSPSLKGVVSNGRGGTAPPWSAGMGCAGCEIGMTSGQRTTKVVEVT